MGKTLKDWLDQAEVASDEYMTRSEIRADSLTAISVGQNFVWAHTGARFGGYSWTPQFRITGDSWQQLDANGNRDLDEISMCGKLTRKVKNSGVLMYGLGFSIFGKDIVVEFSVENLETGVTVGTVELSRLDTQTGWDTDEMFVSPGDVEDGSGNPELLEITMRAKENSADNSGASLLIVEAHEIIISSDSPQPANSYLPDDWE